MTTPTPRIPPSKFVKKQGAPMDAMLANVEWTPLPEWTGGNDLPVATHEGYLEIGAARLKCYTLNDGSRILDADDVAWFFGAPS